MRGKETVNVKVGISKKEVEEIKAILSETGSSVEDWIKTAMHVYMEKLKAEVRKND